MEVEASDEAVTPVRTELYVKEPSWESALIAKTIGFVAEALVTNSCPYCAEELIRISYLEGNFPV
jgi:hypothetical protein